MSRIDLRREMGDELRGPMIGFRTKLILILVVGAIGIPRSSRSQNAGPVMKLSPQDLAEITQLSARYAKAIGTCAAEDYASLFTGDGFYSSSEFTGPKHRELFGTNGGQAIGHDRLVLLVQTEPYCADPNGKRGARKPPAVTIQATADGARGTAPFADGGRYEDVYVKTPDGWKFKSRTHVRAGQTAFEAPALVLTARDEAEIRQLSVRYAQALGLCKADDYAAVFTKDGFYSSSEFTGAKHREMYGPRGAKILRAEMERFVMSEPQCLSSAPKKPRTPPTGFAIKPSSGGATAIIPLANGERYEDIYVKTADGWRIRSREHVRAGQQPFSTRSS